MGAFVVGWLAGQAIITYRSIRDQGGPPWPGQMLAATGLYAILAMLGEFGPGARRLSIALTWGFNIAAFMNLYHISYLPGEAAKGYWAKIKATATSGWGNGQILPGARSSSGTGTGSTPSLTNPPAGVEPLWDYLLSENTAVQPGGAAPQQAQAPASTGTTQAV